MGRRTWAVLSAVVLTATAAGCGRDAEPEPPSPTQESSVAATDFARDLRGRVSVDAMMGHLGKLQEIADAHGGNRALGTPGYDASVDYVADALRGKGFDVQTPEFDVRLPFAEDPALSVDGRAVASRPLEFTVGTPQQGVAGRLVAARVDDSPGCTAGDYDGIDVRGAVVLVDRGVCPFGEKQTAAAERGAVALVVADNADGDQMGGTLGERTEVRIPVVSITKAEGARLRENPGQTSLRLVAGVRTEKTRNVIAQTKTGSTADVVVAGAHLDSVPEGPGINDNGSGVAAVLETALALGSSPDVRNAVRFGFWGAEELGLLGSIDYVESLDSEALKDIALYLNFDMVGSPNPGYFTYDGDQSARPDARSGVPRVPEGSAGIERTLTEYYEGTDKEPEDTYFDGRSDYDGFTRAGIPAGGTFSGAGEDKSAEQAQRWGGEADAPFDPNYHKDTDTLDRIDRESMEINGGAVPYAIGLYAQDQRGRNGVPLREDRTRHPLSDA